jgi:hypothetical protein
MGRLNGEIDLRRLRGDLDILRGLRYLTGGEPREGLDAGDFAGDPERRGETDVLRPPLLHVRDNCEKRTRRMILTEKSASLPQQITHSSRFESVQK